MDSFYYRWMPFTVKIGFLEAKLHDVAQKFRSWREEHFHTVGCSWLDGTIAEMLPQMAPLTIPPRRALLIETRSDWTAYFDNGAQGPDPFGPIGHLAEVMCCRGLIATNAPHTLHSDSGRKMGSYGAVQFELFGPGTDNELGYVRSVSVAFDGGNWRFDANGEMQSFEQPERYNERRVVDRFTPKMLEEYCSALGIGMFDSEFYGHEACLVTVSDPLPVGSPELSLAEARVKLGVQD